MITFAELLGELWRGRGWKVGGAEHRVSRRAERGAWVRSASRVRSGLLLLVAALAISGLVGCSGGSSGGGGGSTNTTPTPSITTVSPTSGAAGVVVTVTGTNFGATQGSNTVTFNNVAATTTSWSNTTIVAPVPGGATTGSVVVTVNGVSSNGVSFGVPPIISGLNASTGAINALISIGGSGFGATQGTSTVTFNGTPVVTVVSWTNTLISAAVPMGSTTGNVVVTVGGLASNGIPFTPGPSVLSLNPNFGPAGTHVTITGTQFGAAQGSSTVTFNNIAATPISWSATSIVATVPAGATSGSVVVTVASLVSNKGQMFTLSSIVPNCGGMPTGDESKLNGNYVFLVQGWNGTGSGNPFASILSFAANGSGGIGAAGGEGDNVNVGGGAAHLTINVTGSVYTVGKDPTSSGDIGCLSLTTPTGATPTYIFSLGKAVGGVYTKGRVARFDDGSGTGNRASGVLLRQTTPFAFPSTSTNLVFGENGWDSSDKAFSGAGFVTMSSSGAFTNLAADFDDNGALNYGLGATSPIPGAANSGGFTAAPDALGRAVVTDHYTVGATTQTFDYAVYQVNANEYLYVSTDAVSSTTPLAAGRAIVTGSSFTNASLSGSYVIHQAGSTGTAAEVGLGLLTFTPGSATIGGSLYQYQTGNSATTETPAATYSISATSGRVALTGASGFGTSGNKPVMYVATPNATTEPISGFVVGSDTDATFGLLEASAGSGFTTAGTNGNDFLGTENPGDNTTGDGIGVVAISGGAGLCVGTEYTSAPAGSGAPGLSVTPLSPCAVTITGGNGFGNVGPSSVAITNGEALFYFTDGSGDPAEIIVSETQ